MEQPNGRTDKRRRGSPSPASSPSPGPSRPNAELTLYSDRRSNKRQRREDDSPDSTTGQLQGHLVSDDVARGHARGPHGGEHGLRNIDQHQGHNFIGGQTQGSARVHNGPTRDHARVLYGNAYDLRNINQHEGNHFEGGQAQDSARVHNGNHYGPINNYNCPPSGVSMPDAGQKSQENSQNKNQGQSQADLTLAMGSLSFIRMDNRQANIQKAYLSTCKWIFGKTEYKNWRNADLASEHNGFFWIKSKPGAGKSTLMKFLVQSAAKQLPNDHVISFFFNARGELLERSLEGLYRGLLHQILTAIPRLRNVLKPQEIASFANQAWPIGRLKDLFSEAATQLGQDRVTCFIDALDECPEREVRDMIEFFGELGESMAEEGIGLRVCFSSRHYPQVTIKKCQPMVLDGQEGHEDDIARYVRSKLKVELNATGDKTAEEVRTAVQAKAKGIFMWVVLVVRILNEESDHGSDNAELRECLDRIPAELHNLFQDILQRGIRDNKYLLPILQWISFAQRPLTREELYFAVRSGSTDFDASQPWDPKAYGSVAMDLFILNASKGLAERTRGKTPTIQFIHESVRDYLRETGFAALAPELGDNLLGLTHDYLKRCCLNFITEPVLARLSLPGDLPKAKSEEAKGLRENASAMFPFLDYATDKIVSHAELACTNGVDQAGFIAALSSSVWRGLASLFAKHDIRRYPPKISIARKFVYVGAANLLSSAFLENARGFGPDELRTAVVAAIKSKNVHLVKVLLSINGKSAYPRCEKEERDLLIQVVKSRDMTTFTALLEGGVPIPTGKNLKDLLLEVSAAGDVQAIRYLSTRGANIASCSADALHAAISRGFDDAVQVLIELGVTLESYITARGQHPIVTAAEHGHVGIVRMLITRGTYPTTPEIMGRSLASACQNSHIDMVSVLLDYSTPLDYSDFHGRATLVTACGHGDLPMVRLLLKSGADVHCKTDVPPIAVACDTGELEIVKALVDSGADPNTPRLIHETTPLSLAFYSFTASRTRRIIEPIGIDETFVRLLLSKSANPNVRCRDWTRTMHYITPFAIAHTEQSRKLLSRTLIYAASIMDNARLLQLLFEKGADANVEGGKDYYDALLDSCLNGRENVVKVLLANGASVVCRDEGYYRGVVQEVTKKRRSRIVELVLTEGHGFRAQERDLYSGSLQMALDNGYDEIARFLMDLGVELPDHTECSNAPDAALQLPSFVLSSSDCQPVATLYCEMRHSDDSASFVAATDMQP
jgi:ankyrin repeat protein